ncbi:MAG: hypothetical protein RM368_29965 [Nostoc sp. DedSLP03]|uniref:RraA family protein n=1 Tax=Nostoc sp. DedSLP03 TaxID=3075400 RepID=UPI002AD2751C|nr:hypothetical protein [Nostoc sp. DedSLP03]MDZ7969129.1 hypothetical protein [Nostoc sp. DedSLP03]
MSFSPDSGNIQPVLTISDLAQQKNLTSSHFFDAVNYLKKNPGVILDLEQYRATKRIVGEVKRTVRFIPIGSRQSKEWQFSINVPSGGIVAIQIEPPNGRSTPVGSIVLESFYQQGVTGVVIGGRLRDVESIPENFPIWALGKTCCGSGGLWEEEIDGLINLFGVPVTLGSLIIADENGLVVSPPLTPNELKMVGKFVDVDDYAKFLVRNSGFNYNQAKNSAREHFGIN